MSTTQNQNQNQKKNQIQDIMNVDKYLMRDYSHLTWKDLIQHIQMTPDNEEEVPMESLLEEFGLPSYGCSSDSITAEKMQLKAYSLMKYTLDDDSCGVFYVTFRDKPFCFMVKLTTTLHWEAEFFQKDLVKDARNLALDLMKNDDSFYEHVKISSADEKIDNTFKPFFNVLYYDSICKKDTTKKIYHGKKIVSMNPSNVVDMASVRLEHEDKDRLVRVDEIDLQMNLLESFISMGRYA